MAYKKVYEETSRLTAKYYRSMRGDYLEYVSNLQIKEGGKTPVVMDINFDGTYPSFDVMPPEQHTFKAASVVDLFLKVTRWFHKYGYEIK